MGAVGTGLLKEVR